MTLSERYYTIIRLIMSYYGFEDVDIIKSFKEKENRYLLLLLTKKYNCYNEEKLKEIINVKTNRSLLNNIKRAEEKLLVNSQFREIYFEIEERLLKYN